MEGFLTFIIFLVIGFYVLGFIVKMLLKLYIRKIQRQAKNFNEAQNFSNFGNSNSGSHSEGDVYVSQVSEPKEKRFKDGVGDYIDYEEVK